MNYSAYTITGVLCASMLLVPACDWLQKVPLAVKEPVVRIIDINTAAVFEDAHIPGALHVDSMQELKEVAESWNRDVPVVTYCSDYNCMSSHKAAQLLIKLGFSDVSVYAGGIREWYKLSKENNERYPLEGPAQMKFLGKDIEILDPEKEEENVITADEVVERLHQK